VLIGYWESLIVQVTSARGWDVPHLSG
jgi:hypothetical protein